MELQPQRLAIGAVLLASLGLAGAFAWSRVTTGDRFYRFARAVGDLGYERGGTLPTDADVRAHVEGLAAAQQLALTDVQVASHSEAGLGALGSAGPALGQVLAGSRRVYAVDVVASSTAGLFTNTRPLHVEFSLRESVSLRAAERPLPALEETMSERGLQRAE